MRSRLVFGPRLSPFSEVSYARLNFNNRYMLYASNSLHHPLKQTTGAAGYVRRAASLGHNPLPQN